MKKRTILVLGLLVALFAATVPAFAEIIRLKSGRVLVGKIEDPDEEGFDFLRFDNRGLLPIKWDHLLTGDVRRLKQKYGLAENEEKEVLVKAFRVTINTEGGRRSVVGLIISRTDDALIIRRRGVRTEIKKDLLSASRPIEEIQVPALEVYTVDEFYQAQLQEILGGVQDDPVRHEKLARTLSSAGAFDHARKHFTKVLELDPEYRNKSAVERNLAQLDAAIKNKGLMELITRVEQAKSRRNYRQAMEIAAELDGKAGEMPPALAELWRVRKKKLLLQRERYLADRVCRTLYAQVRRVAAARSLDKEMNPQSIREFAQKEMGTLVLENTAESLELPIEEVRQLWEKREEIRGCTSIQSASYGEGTFLLSEEEAHAGTTMAKAKTGKEDSKRSQREELNRRIREFLRRQGRQRRGKGGQDQGQQQLQTPEEWWEEAGMTARKSWITAFFAEYGGLMKVSRPLINACKTCGGMGKIKYTDSATGQDSWQKCPACRGYRIQRRVRYY